MDGNGLRSGCGLDKKISWNFPGGTDENKEKTYQDS
jgi:hypothetical protein